MDPTKYDLEDPVFEVIWNVIRHWDIQRKEGDGYAHGTGTDVMAILQPVRDKIHSIQLQEWLQGKNHHNLLTNECCPDFSCCNRHVNTSEEVKAKFIQNHSKNIPNDALLALFLARALESIGHEVTNKDIIEAINQ